MLFGITYSYNHASQTVDLRGRAKFRRVSYNEDAIAGTGSETKEEAVENDLMYMLHTWSSWEESDADQETKDQIIDKVKREIHQLLKLVDTMEMN